MSNDPAAETLAPPPVTGADVARDYFPTQEGELMIGGMPVSQIADEFGTPAYIYDAGVLRSRFARVQDVLGPRVSVLFALKANGNAMVAKTLRLAGAGCEVASAGEIAVARAAGFNGADTQFAGPGKSELDLGAANSHGVYSINAESAGEVERISEMAEKTGCSMNVAIRIQQALALKSSRMRMSGGGTKFGVSASDVSALVRRIADDPNLSFRGLHMYAGTQCFSAEAWIAGAESLLAQAKQVESETGVSVGSLNFGGGFGVPMFSGDGEFDLAAAGVELQGLIENDQKPERRYFVELGRYLTAPAGVYLMRVIDVKQTGETSHAVLDGGMHHHASAVGLGSIIKRSYPIVMPERMAEAADSVQCLGGPLCLPLDEFGAKLTLPKPRVGDLVAILLSGAYGLSFSPVMFLGHRLPCEVLVDDGTPQLVRQRGDEEDILRGQVIS